MIYKYFGVVFLLVCLYSCTNENINDGYSEFAELDTLIREFEMNLLPLETEIKELSDLSADLLRHQDNFINIVDHHKFQISEEGVFYNPNPLHHESSIYISTRTADMKAAINQVYATGPLDSAFSNLINNNPIITQAYFNSKAQFSRLYPNYDVLNILKPDLDVTAFNFYYLADGVRNPDRGPKWVEEIYLDPAGRGWVLSLIYPVYHEDVLEGVVGIDITVEDLISTFLDKSDKDLLIVNSDGMIVASKARAMETLDMPPINKYTYNKTIQADNFQTQEFNLFRSKNREVRRMVSKFLLEQDNKYILNVNGENHTVHCKKMTLMNWYLIALDKI
ncbi:cache domain-containing protein [Anditalea andensis]|uniref:Cache domain-containing protein n=1 Tax=Anditalea andensis TaxID=1048983 RepID=A0A074LFB2_9BACT|nr:cache domain-containing protein [Anditalea andensis]KEO72472.1 hypothetical protein EL17_17185 [Anditalea andensis]